MPIYRAPDRAVTVRASSVMRLVAPHGGGDGAGMPNGIMPEAVSPMVEQRIRAPISGRVA